MTSWVTSLSLFNSFRILVPWLLWLEFMVENSQKDQDTKLILREVGTTRQTFTTPLLFQAICRYLKTAHYQFVMRKIGRRTFVGSMLATSAAALFVPRSTKAADSRIEILLNEPIGKSLTAYTATLSSISAASYTTASGSERNQRSPTTTAFERRWSTT
jgi:hypothetical protein